MYVLHVNDEAYKIRFGYGVLYKSDLIDRVVIATSGETESASGTIKNMIGLTAELLLEGLQKYHKDKFGYDTDEEREEKILEVCELIDDFEDEHSTEDDENQLDGFTLFLDLQRELERNGFLSQITKVGQENAAEQNATKVPQDHKTKKKVGAKQ